VISELISSRGPISLLINTNKFTEEGLQGLRCRGPIYPRSDRGQKIGTWPLRHLVAAPVQKRANATPLCTEARVKGILKICGLARDFRSAIRDHLFHARMTKVSGRTCWTDECQRPYRSINLRFRRSEERAGFVSEEIDGQHRYRSYVWNTARGGSVTFISSQLYRAGSEVFGLFGPASSVTADRPRLRGVMIVGWPAKSRPQESGASDCAPQVKSLKVARKPPPGTCLY